MKINEFKEMVSSEDNNTIAIDFDGVIHKNSKGFHDGTIYDEPIEDVKKGLEYLSKSYKLVIYSCKANPNRPLINGDYIGWNERKVDENGNFIQKLNKDGTKNGFESITIFEHRVVMEEHLGRPLLPTESVHHINMNKQDNRLENLYLCSVSEHSKAHWSINPVIERLIQDGIIDFNVKTGEYYLIKKETKC